MNNNDAEVEQNEENTDGNGIVQEMEDKYGPRTVYRDMQPRRNLTVPLKVRELHAHQDNTDTKEDAGTNNLQKDLNKRLVKMQRSGLNKTTKIHEEWQCIQKSIEAIR